jgi:UDP-galactopyranose mutase
VIVGGHDRELCNRDARDNFGGTREGVDAPCLEVYYCSGCRPAQPPPAELSYRRFHPDGQMPEFDYLIVGCGLTGATLAERIATGLDKKVLIIDKRPHIGGNAHDFHDDAGLLVSTYGAHIFHTNNERVWAYINRFADFNDYVHTVDAVVGGSTYSLPLNLDTLNSFFRVHLTPEQVPGFLAKRRVPIDLPANAEESVLSQVGWELYEAFYKNYTRKQWGIDPRLLDASVTSRLPIRTTADKRYFADRWQGIPRGGYTALVQKMLHHANIEVLLNMDYRKAAAEVRFGRLVFTGPIDLYFDFLHGRLPYRSIDFRFQTLDREYYQHTAVVNYPNDHDYTRCVEYKYLNQQHHARTTVSWDYPCWNDDEPYYPVPASANRLLFQRYRTEADRLSSVLFCGRLGSYQYLNMDQCIAQGLDVFEREIA